MIRRRRMRQMLANKNFVTERVLKLPATLEKFVAAQVEEGVHRSRRAAIVAAVASAKRRAEQRTRLTHELQKGIDSGTAESLTMGAIIRRGGGRLAARKRSEK